MNSSGVSSGRNRFSGSDNSLPGTSHSSVENIVISPTSDEQVTLSCCVCLSESTINDTKDELDDNMFAFPLAQLVSCLHSICVVCAVSLKQRQVISCPLCRTQSNKLVLFNVNKQTLMGVQVPITLIKSYGRYANRISTVECAKKLFETSIATSATPSTSKTSNIGTVTYEVCDDMMNDAAIKLSNVQLEIDELNRSKKNELSILATIKHETENVKQNLQTLLNKYKEQDQQLRAKTSELQTIQKELQMLRINKNKLTYELTVLQDKFSNAKRENDQIRRNNFNNSNNKEYNTMKRKHQHLQQDIDLMEEELVLLNKRKKNLIQQNDIQLARLNEHSSKIVEKINLT